MGTDGIDAPSEAAGAVADDKTLDRARTSAWRLRAFLEASDSSASLPLWAT